MGVPKLDDDDDNVTGSSNTDYWRIKARREKILADRDQLELDVVQKHLVLRDDVHKVAFEASRKLRDNLHSLCKQAAPNLVGMESPSEIEAYLRDEVDLLLEEFIENCV